LAAARLAIPVSQQEAAPPVVDSDSEDEGDNLFAAHEIDEISANARLAIV
jgi:hypothetical protein